MFDSDKYLCRLTNGDLVGTVNMETYPKVMEYANEHKLLVRISTSTLAGRWMPRIYVTLSPDHEFVRTEKGDMERVEF